MAKPYSMDLRERVVAAVETGWSVVACGGGAVWRRRQHGDHLGAAFSGDRQAWRRGKMGGHKPRAIRGEHARLAAGSGQGERDFTLRGLVAELAERGLKVDYRAVWNFVHAEKLSFKKNRGGQRTAIVLTSRAGGRSGGRIRARSSRPAWCSSTRPGPRPTWRRCAAGRRAAGGCPPRSRTAAGRP